MRKLFKDWTIQDLEIANELGLLDSDSESIRYNLVKEMLRYLELIEDFSCNIDTIARIMSDNLSYTNNISDWHQNRLNSFLDQDQLGRRIKPRPINLLERIAQSSTLLKRQNPEVYTAFFAMMK